MKNRIKQYGKELQQELLEILSYWMEHAPDPVHGGFYGKIDNENRVFPDAPKGVVLNSRILWTFAASFRHSPKQEYLAVAKRAYEYILDHFVDRDYGAVYWSVDYRGEVLNDRKQVYGIAFCIYGLTEYYKASLEPDALELAIGMYRLIESHAFDPRRKGYFEAFRRDWTAISDLRLSEKDANDKKTMNTHLHILEAYANLYLVWPDKALKQQIEKLLEVFAHHIVNDETHHLNLFFDENWAVRSNLVSYGHDIEAAWLMQSAAEVIQHPGWALAMRSLAVKISDAVMEAVDEKGGLKYESENGRMIAEKHWWPQAEAMVGFFNAYQITGDEKYMQQSIRSWQYVKQYIRDAEKGEWFWGVAEDGSLMQGYDKVGFWKCPYHNARACLELIQRIERIFNLQS
ncbi:MAG TPA: AGE family epimerase/isomerase [Puia sp.]|nr:AGE family epimerase/isomerase [Puia sp.]